MDAVNDAVYRVEATRVMPSRHAGGPWNTSLQHGAAPAALVAWAAERIPAGQPMQVVRLTIDLLRPIPIAPLELETEVVREGRKIQVASVRLLADGTEVVRASVLKIRAARFVLPDTAVAAAPELPGPELGIEPRELTEIPNPFLSGMSLRAVRGGFRQAGPAAIWFRADRAIVEGAAITPLMRAAITADFCNGASAVLDFHRWTFINGDLTVNLSRLPDGDWILLDAETWVGPDGSGLAAARLADLNGYFGRAVQSIVVEPR